MATSGDFELAIDTVSAATAWTIVTSPNTSTTQSNYLESVSCASATSCMAVGYYLTGGYDQTLVEEWTGSAWSIVT